MTMTRRDSYAAYLETLADNEIAAAENTARGIFAEMVTIVEEGAGMTFERWLRDTVADDSQAVGAAERWLVDIGPWLASERQHPVRAAQISAIAGFLLWTTEIQWQQTTVH